ncbi:MAG: hypothetical protein ACRC6X_01765 [Culicoidibacterales bacterium]
MKSLRAISIVGAISCSIYAAVSVFAVKWSAEILGWNLNARSPEEFMTGLPSDRMTAVRELMILELIIALLAIALFIVGVVVIVKNSIVRQKSKARSWGLTAGIMTVAGFSGGWIQFVNVLYVLLTLGFYIASARGYQKLINQETAEL